MYNRVVQLQYSTEFCVPLSPNQHKSVDLFFFKKKTQKLTYHHLIYPEGFLGAMSVSTSPGIPTPNSHRDIYFDIILRFKSLLRRNGSRAILLNLTREGRISHSGLSSKSTVGVEKAHYIGSNISSPPLLSCGAWMTSGTHYTHRGNHSPVSCHVNLEASRINYLSRRYGHQSLWYQSFTVCIINMPFEYPPSIDPWNYSENWFILPRSEVEVVNLRRFDRRRALFKTLRISPCPIQIIVLQLPQERQTHEHQWHHIVPGYCASSHEYIAIAYSDRIASLPPMITSIMIWPPSSF